MKVLHNEEKNDFFRNAKGEIDLTIDEYYIDCYNDIIIYNYGNHTKLGEGILVAYIPSLGRGHNIINKIEKHSIEILSEENDAEVFIYFNIKNIDKVCSIVKAKTSGASISPLSEKNLEWINYEIPQKDLDKYRVSSKDIPINAYRHIYSEFAKKNKLDLDRKRKLAKLPIKEYIHSLGLWKKYCKFLEEYNGKEV